MLSPFDFLLRWCESSVYLFLYSGSSQFAQLLSWNHEHLGPASKFLHQQRSKGWLVCSSFGLCVTLEYSKFALEEQGRQNFWGLCVWQLLEVLGPCGHPTWDSLSPTNSSSWNYCFYHSEDFIHFCDDYVWDGFDLLVLCRSPDYSMRIYWDYFSHHLFNFWSMIEDLHGPKSLFLKNWADLQKQPVLVQRKDQKIHFWHAQSLACFAVAQKLMDCSGWLSMPASAGVWRLRLSRLCLHPGAPLLQVLVHHHEAPSSSSQSVRNALNWQWLSLFHFGQLSLWFYENHLKPGETASPAGTP